MTAPMRRAVAMAWSPATPAPITSPFAGATVPAAVIIMGMNRLRALAAISAPLYPASDAIDVSASMLWARAVLGTASMLKPVIRLSASS